MFDICGLDNCEFDICTFIIPGFWFDAIVDCGRFEEGDIIRGAVITGPAVIDVGPERGTFIALRLIPDARGAELVGGRVDVVEICEGIDV